MTEAVGYTRLSQDSDTSIERQKTHIREYAADRGFKLQQIYDDGEWSSGFDETREEYQQVRDRVQEGTIAAVIVNDKRRLARDFDETMRLVLDLREHDVEAHTFQEGRLDLSDPVQAAVEVLQAASEHEAKKKEIERAREAVADRLKAGFDHGRPPFGLTFDEAGEYWVPGEEFETALEVLDLRESGATYSEITEETGVTRSTAHRIIERKDRYRSLRSMA